MRALSYSEVRNNLASVLDKVIDDVEPTIVTRRGDIGGERAVIIMSLDSYNSMNETAYLLRGKNREPLLKSIAQLRAGQARERKLVEVEEGTEG